MKKSIIFISIAIILMSFIKKDDFNLINFKDSLFVDRTEITNLDWREYVYWNLKKFGDDSKEYLQSLPDTTVWESDTSYNKPYVVNYYQHPAYSKYPVVGISFNQANSYCKWRSDRVNEMIYMKENKLKYSDLAKLKDVPAVYSFRLPTKKEWIEFSNYDIKKKYLRKVFKKFEGNYRIIDERVILGNFANGNTDITLPVESYFPNELGLYNVFGNVAEMTSDEGIAMGGSFTSSLDNFSLTKEYNYKKAEVWLGFRCVAKKKLQ